MNCIDDNVIWVDVFYFFYDFRSFNICRVFVEFCVNDFDVGFEGFEFIVGCDNGDFLFVGDVVKESFNEFCFFVFVCFNYEDVFFFENCFFENF